MKHIKAFEDVKPKLELLTYVICDEESKNLEFKKFLRTHIGIIDAYHNGLTKDEMPYIVYYADIPKSLKEYFNDDPNYPNCRVMREKEIIFHSKYRKKLEPLILIDKFNI